jgi:hypothetical protein
MTDAAHKSGLNMSRFVASTRVYSPTSTDFAPSQSDRKHGSIETVRKLRSAPAAPDAAPRRQNAA